MTRRSTTPRMGFDLLVLEVLHGAAVGPLERYGKDALTVCGPCGGTPWRNTERTRGPRRGEHCVAKLLRRSFSRCWGKRDDRLGAEVVHVELDDRAVRLGGDETQQQHQAVPVALDCVGTVPRTRGRWSAKNVRRACQVVRAGGGHRGPSGPTGPATRAPQCRRIAHQPRPRGVRRTGV